MGGDLAGAEAALRRAEERRDTDGAAAHALGEVLRERGDREGAHAGSGEPGLADIADHR